MDEKNRPESGSHSAPAESLQDRLVALIKAHRAEQALMVLGILYTFYFARSLILPVFIALFLAAVLHPLVRKLNVLRIPDPVGAALVVVAFLTLVVLAVFYLSQPVANWLSQRPAIVGQVEAKVAKLKKPIEQAQKTTERLGKVADLGEEKGQRQVTVKSPGIAGYVVSGFWYFLGEAAVVLVLTYFFLAQGRVMLLRVTGSFRDPNQGERVRSVLSQAQADVSRYLLTYVVINAAIALVVTLLMLVLGMPTPLLWGIVAGGLNFIPYLGPGCALGIITLVSLLSFETLATILAPPLAYLGLIVVEGNFITPAIMSNRLSMNPIVVFLSILFWGWVWGVPGVFLAVPILATLKIILNAVDTARPIREALA